MQEMYLFLYQEHRAYIGAALIDSYMFFPVKIKFSLWLISAYILATFTIDLIPIDLF